MSHRTVAALAFAASPLLSGCKADNRSRLPDSDGDAAGGGGGGGGGDRDAGGDATGGPDVEHGPDATAGGEAGIGCDRSSDCPLPLICGPRGTCITECLTQRDCRPGELCTNGSCVGDRDFDGIEEPRDNCPDDPNPDQRDLDRDGHGDECDDDQDGDSIVDADDNCPGRSNPDQENGDDRRFECSGQACGGAGLCGVGCGPAGAFDTCEAYCAAQGVGCRGYDYGQDWGEGCFRGGACPQFGSERMGCEARIDHGVTGACLCDTTVPGDS